MKKIGILIIALLLTVTLTSCGGTKTDTKSNSGSDSANADTLIVGFDQNFPPMGFVGEDGEFTGFDIELAKLAAEKMGMDIKLQPINWDSKDAELETGNINCIWNGFTMTGREGQYNFSKPYMKNRQVLVVLEDSEYQNLSDFAGKTIELQQESTSDNALEANKEFKDSLGEVTRVAENMTALNDLEVKACDAVLMDEIVARYNISQGRKFRVIEQALSEEEYAVGFKLGEDELTAKVDKALEELNNEKKLEELSIKYFAEDITTIGK